MWCRVRCREVWDWLFEAGVIDRLRMNFGVCVAESVGSRGMLWASEARLNWKGALALKQHRDVFLTLKHFSRKVVVHSMLRYLRSPSIPQRRFPAPKLSD